MFTFKAPNLCSLLEAQSSSMKQSYYKVGNVEVHVKRSFTNDVITKGKGFPNDDD